LLRMPVVTKLLFNGPHEHASAMLVIAVGKGKLILTQIPLPKNQYRSSGIYWSQIFTNLKINSSLNLFDGEKVVAGAQKSNGYPETVRFIKNPGEVLLEKIIGKGEPGEAREGIHNQGLSEGFKWERIKTPDGQLAIPTDCKEFVIFYEMRPGRPRKIQEVVGGLPDPSQQTLIDFWGKGKVTIYVNGKKFQPLNLDGTKGNVSDIDLNQNWNSIIIHFVPDSKDFKMLWRNRQGQPELEFAFN